MILYLDTSALLKRYFKEPHSTEVISRWKEAAEIVTSSVAYAETMATFYRKKREVDLGSKMFKRIINLFQRDWKGFIRVAVTDDLNEYMDKIFPYHQLRGFDAIHLASALIVHESVPENFLFACFDQRLLHAAKMAGLETFPPYQQ